MLKRIVLNKYIDNDSEEYLGEVVFNKGINEIFDGQIASINKLSFLAIIDMAFGGGQSSDIRKIVDLIGEFNIHIYFIFEGVTHEFSRSSYEMDKVIKYESERDIKEFIISDYTLWLRNRYRLNMSIPDLLFRDIVNQFIRVKNDDFENIMHADKSGVKHYLLKLFNLNKEIQRLEERCDSARRREYYYRYAIDYGHVNAAACEDDVKKNNEIIYALEQKIENFIKRLNHDLLYDEPLKSERVMRLKAECSKLRMQRINLESQLRVVNDNYNAGDVKFKKDFDDLKRVFPNSKIESLREIEVFHKKITSILNSEFKSKIEEIYERIDILNESLNNKELEIKQIESLSSHTEIALDTYTDLINEKRNIENANAGFYKKIKLKELADHAKDVFEIKMSEKLSYIEGEINRTIYSICDSNNWISIQDIPIISIHGKKNHTNPQIAFKAINKSYMTAVFWDIACLYLTDVPFLIHGYQSMNEEIYKNVIRAYEKVDKQMFIAV